MLGEKIRSIRKKQDMKLNDLSELSGLSASYISQLERGLVEPSLSSLKKISTALKTPVYLLMEESSSGSVVVKKDERMKMSFPNSELEFEIVSAMSSKLDFDPSMLVVNFIFQESGEESEGFMIHAAEEIVIVEVGQLEVMIGDEIHLLDKGDSIYIKENVPHRIRNIYDGVTSGFYIVSPPQMPDKYR